MENTSFGVGDGSPYVIGNSKAPYINNTLIGTEKYTSLSNWYSIEHNSPLDYMDAISGCDHNGFTRPYPDHTLVNELDGVGTTWKAYMDGLAAGQNCYTGKGSARTATCRPTTRSSISSRSTATRRNVTRMSCPTRSRDSLRI
jgi:hypothetical protein